MSIGRGATGLLSNLRTFADLVDDSATDRQQIIDLAPGREMGTTWIAGANNVYSQRCHEVFDSHLLDVFGADTMVEPRPLARVESLALCETTPGSYFFDFSAASLPVGWWDDGSLWDDGGLWDADGSYVEGTLYIKLPDSSNPANTQVVVHLGFHAAGDGKVLAVLSPDKLLDGKLDNWTTTTNLTSWTETAAFVSQDTPLSGTGYAARFSGSLPSGASSITQGGHVGRAGAHYFFSGDYYTDPLNPSSIEARIRVAPDSGVGNFMTTDGRETTTNAVGMTLANTNGERRRFLFVFRCTVNSTALQVLVGAYNTSGGALAGVVKFDNVKLQRVNTYSYYQPRLSEASLPETEVAVPGIYWGQRTVGLGSASLLLGDGAWDKALGTLFWAGHLAVVATGGAFQDGQDLTRDDYRTAFAGTMKQPVWSDEAVQIEMEDTATFMANRCPARTYNLSDRPNLFLNDEGYSIPYWWGFLRETSGAVDSIRPARVDKSTSTLYGTYEACDPTIAVNGVTQILVYSYPTVEDAERATRQYPLSSSYVTVDLAACGFAVIDDVRNYRYDRGGNDVGTGAAFDFNIGAGALVATVNLEGPATLVASTLQAAMNAIAGTADITVAYSHTTHKFTVGKGAGTLNLLMKTGVNSHIGSWGIFGFDLDLDRTGSLSYLGDNATFTDPDVDHIIRVAGKGYKDDASGTMSGFANTELQTPAEIAVHLLMKVGKRPASQLNLPSFRFSPGAAGFTASPLLLLWIREVGTLADALAIIERSSFSDIVIDGDGIIHFRPHALMEVVAEFFDRDFISFDMGPDTENVFKGARIYYGQNPQLGSYRSRDDTAPASASVPIKYGRDDVLEVYTALMAGIQPVDQLNQIGPRYARLAAANPMRVRFTAMSKLLDLLIGDKIRITRSRAPTPTGTLEAATFRIRRLRHNYLTGVSHCTAVEDVPFLS